MAKSDTEFARAAISLKLVTQDQANECLRLLAQLRQKGTKASIADVLVQKGYLDRAKVAAVLRAQNQPRISHIGNYKLIARVGQGGMGSVYKAMQESLDKIVALKVLAPALARKGDFVERFVREAQSSGRLNHPNIVHGIDAGAADGYYYFAMEFVDGESLKAMLLREGKLPETRALEITAAMAAALEHATEHQIVHRDIKPGNILLTTDGTAKLADLGLAKEVRTDHSITQAGIPVGTPYYISPEQVRGEQQIDGRADIYALGGTLYHMVTGTVPYEGPTAAVVMTRHLNDPIPDAKAHTPDVSDAVLAIIHHCMAKEPGDRYATPTELRQDVEAALAGKPLRHAKKVRAAAAGKAAQRAAERKAKQDAQRRKLLVIGGAIAGVVVLAIVLALVLRNGKPQGKTQAVAPPRTSAPAKTRPRPKAKRKPKPVTRKPKPRVSKPKATAVLRELIDFAAEADDHDDIEKRFRDFVLDYAGTPSARKAKAHIGGLKAAWKAEADFKATIERHVDDHEFGNALAALAKPPFKKKTAATTEMLEELTRNVQRAAEDHIDAQKTRGEKHIDQGELAEARKLFVALAKVGLPDAADASREALARIAKLEARARERKASGAFAALVVKAAQAVAAGRLAEARGLLDPAKADRNPTLATLLKQAQGDIDRISTLFDAVEAELAARARTRKGARIKGIMRPVTKVANHVVYCTIGRRSMEFPIREMSGSDIAELKCAPKADLIPLLELYRGQVAAAKEEFAKLPAAATDPNIKRSRQLIEWLGAIGREDEARQLLAKATKLADRKDWAGAQAAVNQLIGRCGQTAFVEEHGAAIKSIADRCTAVLAAARRDTQTIKPFIYATDRSGHLGKMLKNLKPVGGWVMDIDNDGLLDIALDVRHRDKPWVPVFLNRTKPGDKDLVFKDATLVAGIDTGNEPICWADLDGDGDLDIVCRGLWTKRDGERRSDHSKLSIYENRPSETPMFVVRPELSLTPHLAKVPGYGGFGFGNIAVIDANGDGRADVLAQFVSGKPRTLAMFISVPGKPFNFRDYSGRAGFVRKKGDQYSTPEHLDVKAWPNYVVFDGDGDHRTDFIFNTDTGMFFRNRSGRTFSYLPRSTVEYKTYASPATNNNPLIVPAVADYDNDGDIDIFVPQKARNLLLRNKGGGRFEDAMHTAGPMSTDEAVSLWATWADVNNDGLLDLFVCNSGERNRLYIQLPNHAFVDKAEEFGCTGEKGEKTNFVAFGDLDRDGDLDMVILRDNGRSQLLLNPYVTGDNRTYLSVVVEPPLGAIGAKVYLIRPPDQIVGLQQVCRVEGYNGQTSREAFFGVPAAGDYIVRVVLSNGKKLTRRHTVNASRPNRIVIRK